MSLIRRMLLSEQENIVNLVLDRIITLEQDILSAGKQILCTDARFANTTRYMFLFFSVDPKKEMNVAETIECIGSTNYRDSANLTRWTGSALGNNSAANASAGITIDTEGNFILHVWSNNFPYLAGDYRLILISF